MLTKEQFYDFVIKCKADSNIMNNIIDCAVGNEKIIYSLEFAVRYFLELVVESKTQINFGEATAITEILTKYYLLDEKFRPILLKLLQYPAIAAKLLIKQIGEVRSSDVLYLPYFGYERFAELFDLMNKKDDISASTLVKQYFEETLASELYNTIDTRNNLRNIIFSLCTKGLNQHLLAEIMIACIKDNKATDLAKYIVGELNPQDFSVTDFRGENFIDIVMKSKNEQAIIIFADSIKDKDADDALHNLCADLMFTFQRVPLKVIGTTSAFAETVIKIQQRYKEHCDRISATSDLTKITIAAYALGCGESMDKVILLLSSNQGLKDLVQKCITKQAIDGRIIVVGENADENTKVKTKLFEEYLKPTIFTEFFNRVFVFNSTFLIARACTKKNIISNSFNNIRIPLETTGGGRINFSTIGHIAYILLEYSEYKMIMEDTKKTLSNPNILLYRKWNLITDKLITNPKENMPLISRLSDIIKEIRGIFLGCTIGFSISTAIGIGLLIIIGNYLNRSVSKGEKIAFEGALEDLQRRINAATR